MKYETFEIQILPATDGRLEIWARSSLGEASGLCGELPEAGDGWLDPAPGPVRARDFGWRQRETWAPQECGGMLYKALFTSQVGSLLERSLSHVSRLSNYGLRLQLRFDPDDPVQARLAQLPWESLCEPSKNRFLSHQEGTPVVRHLACSGHVPSFQLPRVLRVLLVQSDPRKDLELHKESRNIEGAWNQDNVLVDVLRRGPEERLGEALREALRQQDYHVLHFMGHGKFDLDKQIGYLVFESADGREDLVSGQWFAYWLQNCRTLRLVVLNACSTARSSREGNLFAGVATVLVRDGVPGVLAMASEIADAKSIEFSRVLYRQIARGKGVEAALSTARHGLYRLDEGSDAWITPVLWTRTPEILRSPPTIGPTLSRLWTVLGILVAYVSINIWLRTISSPFALPGLTFREVNPYLVSIIGMLLCLPMLFVLMYVVHQYQKGFRESELIRRWPVAFDLPIGDWKIMAALYQYGSFFLFLLLPTAAQIQFFMKMMQGIAAPRKEGVCIGGLDLLTQWVPPSVLWTDQYRYIGSKMTFFPFWEPWAFLIAIVALTIILISVVRELIR